MSRKRKRKVDGRIPRSVHNLWRDWNIYSGYSIKQTSKAIRDLMKEHKYWMDIETNEKIKLIQGYMDKHNIEKTCL